MCVAALRAFEPAWTALHRTIPPFWTLRVTPALPDAGPAPTRLVFFAYAAGMDPALSDAERVSRPFAQLAWADDAQPEILSTQRSARWRTD